MCRSFPEFAALRLVWTGSRTQGTRGSHGVRGEVDRNGGAESWNGRDHGEEAAEHVQDTDFPGGRHPLEGVPNVASLPVPEALNAKVDLVEVCTSFWST